MKLIAIKTPDNHLVPAYNSDLDHISKIKDGKMLLMAYWTPRNPKHHRLIFAMAKCALDNMSGPWNEMYMRDKNNTPYKFIKAIEMEIGLTDDYMNLDGTVRQEPKSIAFENMSEEDFEPISDAVSEVCARVINVPINVFRKNYLQYL